MQIQSDGVDGTPGRSVFSNFGAHAVDGQGPVATEVADTALSLQEPLQTKIDAALARCFIYRFLAAAFEYPSEETWNWVISPETQLALQASVSDLPTDSGAPLWRSCARLLAQLQEACLDDFVDTYLVSFGHAARGPCPMNEIEYGDLKADPLFQPHRLADLSAFYRAFGLEVGDDAAERQDHLSIELEFMSVLAGKEAFALEHQLTEEIPLCVDAQRKFLREHLGRWLPACIWRLSKSAAQGLLEALGAFAREFVAADCKRLGITPGSEELLLRPIDEAGESLCSSCGITNLPPGALTAT